MNAQRKGRERLKQAIKELLQEEGPLKQGDIPKELYGEYDVPYSSKDSIATTLSQVREKWEETQMIDTEQVPADRGSLMTYKWRLKD